MKDGSALRAVRLDRLLTQEELAHKAGVCVRTIISIEKGNGCRVTTQRWILKALGIPFERRRELFGDPRPRAA